MYPLLAAGVLTFGLILYFFAKHPKLMDLGRICIWLGLAFTLYFYGGK